MEIVEDGQPGKGPEESGDKSRCENWRGSRLRGREFLVTPGPVLRMPLPRVIK